ncbi:MAG: SEC-C metal-binding domain-containing protein [Kofleriaceae bacterium]
MQLVDVGRNEPCPCGSARKYKKCCLGAREDAIAGSATDVDPAALVANAIETDDWGALHDLVDRAMEVFEVGGPLEHVRFRDDVIEVREPDDVELSRLCTPGWLARCELEIAHVLARFELEADVRDGLRMAAHLVRRFGAQAPIVEELARVQVGECVDRRRRLANAMSAHGIALADVQIPWLDIVSWLERTRPSILSFAEWFALRAAPDTSLETIWISGIARSVAETCLDRLEAGPSHEAPWWAALAGLVMVAGTATIGRYLVQATPLQAPTVDEQIVHDSIQHRRQHEGRGGILHDILRTTESRRDFVGAALIRETMRLVQDWKR